MEMLTTDASYKATKRTETGRRLKLEKAGRLTYLTGSPHNGTQE